MSDAESQLDAPPPASAHPASAAAAIGDYSKALRGHGAVAIGDYPKARRGASDVGTPPVLKAADAQLDKFTLDQLRAESQRLERWQPIARGMLGRWIDLVGAPTLQCRTRDRAWNAAAERYYADWSQSSADIRGLESFEGLLSGALRLVHVDGDCLVVKHVDAQGTPTLQLVEAQCITDGRERQGVAGQHRHKASANSNIINGIESDAAGRPVRYHLARYNSSGRIDPASVTSIEAELAIYLSGPLRPSQSRGVPRLVYVAKILEKLGEYIQAVCDAATVAAYQALLIVRNNASTTVGLMPGSDQTIATGGSAGSTQRQIKLSPGMVHALEPGEDVKGFNPTQPQAQFAEFVRTLCRVVGCEYSMPLEMVLIDHSQSTAYAGRAAYIQTYRAVDTERARLERTLCVPVYRWLIDDAQARGLITDQDGNPLQTPRDWRTHQWIWPARPSFEPDRDLAAAGMAINLNLTTASAELRKQGLDPDTVFVERSEELRRMAELGITPAGVPGAVAGPPPAAALEPATSSATTSATTSATGDAIGDQTGPPAPAPADGPAPL